MDMLTAMPKTIQAAAPDNFMDPISDASAISWLIPTFCFSWFGKMTPPVYDYLKFSAISITFYETIKHERSERGGCESRP